MCKHRLSASHLPCHQMLAERNSANLARHVLVSIDVVEVEGAEALDRFGLARRNPGRRDRRVSELLNHAYAMMLAGHFQCFCRNLHSEAAQHLASVASPPALGGILHARLVEGRKLDQLLADLINWRNAIAHQNFAGSKPLVPSPPLQFGHVDRWRSACNAIAPVDGQRGTGSIRPRRWSRPKYPWIR